MIHMISLVNTAIISFIYHNIYIIVILTIDSMISRLFDVSFYLYDNVCSCDIKTAPVTSVT